MDIGKEYRLFDVTGEWMMLYGFTAFQLITVVIGFVLILKKEPIKAHLFRIDNSEQENLFLSMHHIALVCGALGLIGVALSMTGLIVPLQFRTALMIVVSVLVICPLVLIILYWLVSMAKSRRGEWTDEKQRADTGRAAITALIVYLATMVAVVVITVLNAVDMPLSFWLLSVFFMMMTAFSGVIIKRNA